MEWYQFFGLLAAIYAMHRETYKESKDFHGRLCRLEEKYIHMMERFMKNKE